MDQASLPPIIDPRDHSGETTTVTADPTIPTAAADRPLVDDIRQLASDARTLAEAEFAYQTSRAKVLGAGLGKIAALGAVALVLVFFAAMALVMGLVLALTPLITAWGATAVVVIVLAGGAAALGLSAKSRWTRLSTLISDQGGSA